MPRVTSSSGCVGSNASSPGVLGQGSQIDGLLSFAEDASMAPDPPEPRGWDAYDAVRFAISAQLASGAGWSLGGYTYKIRAGPGQSV